MTPPLDHLRFAMELVADEEALTDLAPGSDDHTVVRPIDLHFKGDLEAIGAIELSHDAKYNRCSCAATGMPA